MSAARTAASWSAEERAKRAQLEEGEKLLRSASYFPRKNS